MRVPGCHPILLAFLALCACGEAPVEHGGSGTDAGNVLTVQVVSPLGEAVPEAVVEVRSSTVVPARDGSGPAYRAISDAKGEAKLLLPAGDWSIVIRSGTYRAWRRKTLPGTEVDTLAFASRLVGTFRGAAGLRVAVPGLGLSSDCDSAGVFVLDSIPAGEFPLMVLQGDVLRDSTRVSIPAGADFKVDAAVDSLPQFLTESNRVESTH